MWIGRLDESIDLSWLPEDVKNLRPLITGRAIHPIKTYHPHEWPETRVYLEEELAKAAEGWIGTTPTFEHAWEIDGWKVVATKYSDGELKYAIQPQHDNILELVRNGKIKHASIGFDWMVPGGGIKFVNGIAPYGFKPLDIALLKDLPPGDPSTTVHLWENVAKKLKEQQTPEAPKKDEHGCIIGVEEWNPDVHQCVKIITPTPKEQIKSAPYTPAGPPEATIGKKLERIERQLDLFKAQIAGIIETLDTLGYDISTLERTVTERRKQEYERNIQRKT